MDVHRDFAQVVALENERLRQLGRVKLDKDSLTSFANHLAPDEREVTARDNKRLGRRLSVARLRQNAVVEDADLRTPRGLDRGLFQSLSTCGWIRESQHLLIGGPTAARRVCSPTSLPHAVRDGWRG